MIAGAAQDGYESLARERTELELLRERVAQLQTALESRVVIEQAKGILAARLDCPVEDAFEILRRAARTHRMRIHDLAADVVASRAVPAKVVRVRYADGARPGT